MAALIGTARRLFAERGYANVSGEEIVSSAGVTRGALYHHFADKRDLFRAVLEEVESEVTDHLRVSVATAADRWAGMLAALDGFLDLCQTPDVARIVLTDAPAVVGWQTWRDIEARHGLGLITDILEDAARERTLAPVAVPMLAQLILSALIEAALRIAHADDPRKARNEARQALLALLSGVIVQP